MNESARIIPIERQGRPESYFVPDAPESNNVRKIVAGLRVRGIPVEIEVPMRSDSGAPGRIDIIGEFDGKLYGWEVKKYTIGAPSNIADGIAQAADYARAEIASGTWQGRRLDFVFLGPAPNEKAEQHYVPARMLSRYTGPIGVGMFDQQMGVYAFGQEAIRFSPTTFRFYANFDRVGKHKREFRR